jgi:hypothetical protein
MSLPRMLLTFIAAGLVAVGILAQVPVPKPSSQSPQLSDDSRLQILTAFQKAMMYSTDLQVRKNELCNQDDKCKYLMRATHDAVAEYNELMPKIVTREKLPEWTGFNVDVASSKVNVVVPDKAPEPVPAPATKSVPVPKAK